MSLRFVKGVPHVSLRLFLQRLPRDRLPPWSRIPVLRLRADPTPNAEILEVPRHALAWLITWAYLPTADPNAALTRNVPATELA
jgi:hypothetical protein